MSPMVGFITQKEAKLASRPSPRDLDARLSRTEQRIVDAARTCFEASGIGKTRLEDIAISAGVSRQTIYKYFTGKQDIVDQIGFLEMVKITGILRTTLNSAEGFAERLTNAIVLSVEISIENTYISRAIEDINALPGFPGANERILDWQRQKWRPMMERAAARGELASDLDAEALLQWIILCQLMLTLSYRRLVANGLEVRPFVRRFMVEPLLANRSGPTPAHAGDTDADQLRTENAMLRALVSDQALDLFRLKNDPQRL